MEKQSLYIFKFISLFVALVPHKFKFFDIFFELFSCWNKTYILLKSLFSYTVTTITVTRVLSIYLQILTLYIIICRLFSTLYICIKSCNMNNININNKFVNYKRYKYNRSKKEKAETFRNSGHLWIRYLFYKFLWISKFV